MPVGHASAAMAHIEALNGDVTLDIADGVGHELHPALIARAVERLTSRIPLRTWRAALGD